jgi:hypothetical protein
MSNHSFSASFTGSAHETVAKVRGAIEKADGKLNGDDERGDFVVPTPAGKVTGTYAVAGQALEVDITDKPFIVPASTIEGQVRKFLA